MMSNKPVQLRPHGQHPYKSRMSCESCYGTASVEAFFEIGDAIVVRQYCDECVQKAEF